MTWSWVNKVVSGVHLAIVEAKRAAAVIVSRLDASIPTISSLSLRPKVRVPFPHHTTGLGVAILVGIPRGVVAIVFAAAFFSNERNVRFAPLLNH